MKRILAMLAIVTLASCAPAPAPVQAWKTLDGIAVSVDRAMQASADLYKAGRLNDAQKDEIIRAHDIYRPIAQAAHAAVKVWLAADPQATTMPDDIGQKLADTQAAAGHLLQTAKAHKVK